MDPIILSILGAAAGFAMGVSGKVLAVRRRSAKPHITVIHPDGTYREFEASEDEAHRIESEYSARTPAATR